MAHQVTQLHAGKWVKANVQSASIVRRIICVVVTLGLMLGPTAIGYAGVPQQASAKATFYTASDKQEIVILAYHCVNDKAEFVNSTEERWTTSTRAFIKQLNWLIDNHYSVVSLDDAYTAMTTGKTLPPQPVVLTFDDGVSDAYTHVFPILQERRMSGTFFVVAERVSKGIGLNWHQLVQMANNGMLIGSHTMTHAYLPGKVPVEVFYELQQSKTVLEQNVGRPVRFIAYPFGQHTPFISSIAKETGYQAALTTQPGLWGADDGIFGVKRIQIERGVSLEQFAKLLSPATHSTPPAKPQPSKPVAAAKLRPPAKKPVAPVKKTAPKKRAKTKSKRATKKSSKPRVTAAITPKVRKVGRN